MLKRHFFLIVAASIAALFWFSDSAIHYFGYGEANFEFVPSEFNELWMRSVIALLLLAFGAFADHRNRIEKYAVYSAMVDATNHILKNFLQKMLLIRDEAENSKDFNKEVLELYDQMIRETTAQIRHLENIREPTRKSIEDRYRPK